MNVENILWRHNKTDKIYKTLGTVINCTNSNDGQLMYLYTDGNLTFVREANEFLEKFTACELLEEDNEIQK